MYTSIIKDMARRLVRLQIEKENESIVTPYVKARMKQLIMDLSVPPLRNKTNYMDVYEVDVRGYKQGSGGLDLNIIYEDVLSLDPRKIKDQKSKFLLVPVFGFTESLHFITKGGGSLYDKYIAEHPDTVTIGIATEARSVFFIPEAHDKPLDYIITEKRILELC